MTSLIRRIGNVWSKCQAKCHDWCHDAPSFDGASCPGRAAATAASPRTTLPGAVKSWHLAIASLLLCASAVSAVPPLLGSPVSFETGFQPYSSAIEDLNGDSLPDLAVANFQSNTISILFNLGGAVFAQGTNYSTGIGPRSVSVGDLDGDGRPDLVTANSGSDSVSVFRNLGAGSFAPGVTHSVGDAPYHALIGDLNGDSRLDIAASNTAENSMSILTNMGNGSFSASALLQTGRQPTFAAIADFDGDARSDIVVANFNDPFMSFIRNLGGGVFAQKVDYPVGRKAIAVGVADLDGDDDSDAVVANYNDGAPSTVSVLRNQGNGVFIGWAELPVGAGPCSVALGLIDDGLFPDIVVANLDDNTISLIRNLGSGIVEPPLSFGVPGRPRGLAIGDLNDDGRPDIAAAMFSTGDVTILANQFVARAFVSSSAPSEFNDGTSWANAYRELRTALTDLESAPWVREIWVATGTYTPAPPNGPRTASFNLRNNLAIYGGFAGNETILSQRNITQNPAVLSGDLQGDDVGLPFPLGRGDNSEHVLTAAGANATAVIDGFIIQSGYASALASGPGGVGGGLMLWNDAPGSPVIRNCRFEDNVANNGGAAFVGLGSSPFFDTCIFVNNRAQNPFAYLFGGRGGAIAVEGGAVGQLVARRCRFENNYAEDLGGAVYTGATATGMSQCDFARNSTGPLGRGGAACDAQGGLSLIYCNFNGNRAAVGSAVVGLYGSQTSLAHCAVVGNQTISPTGFGAVAIESGSPQPGSLSLVNTTVAFNDSQSGAAGIGRTGTAGLSIISGLVWGNASGGVTNETAQIAVPEGTPPYFIWASSVQGFTGLNASTLGDCNAADPMFAATPDPVDGQWGDANDDYGNLRLTSGSPALDAGVNSEILMDFLDFDSDGNTSEPLPFDLDGSPRIQNGIVDRGAYEGFRCPTCPQDRQWFSPQSGEWSDDARWSFSLPTLCTFALFDLDTTYGVSFDTGDSARGVDVLRGDVTFAGEAITSTLLLSPPPPSLVCPGQNPDPSRPTLRVSGAIGDDPSLTLTRAIVFGDSGFIGDGLLERGTVTVTGVGTTINMGSSLVQIGDFGLGTLNVLNGATFVAGRFTLGQNAIDLDSPPDGLPDNHAFVVVDGPGSFLRPELEVALQNGEMRVSNGAVVEGSSKTRVVILRDSVLSGDGEVRCPVINRGVLAPERPNAGGVFSPAEFRITGFEGVPSSYRQLSVSPTFGADSGVLRLRAGVAPGGGIVSDSLRVEDGGTARVAGTLEVRAVDPTNFAPITSTAAYELVNAAAVTGRFDLAVFPGLTGDRYLALSYGANERAGSISVTVTKLGGENINLNPEAPVSDAGRPTGVVAVDLVAGIEGLGFPDLALTVPDPINPTTAPGQLIILQNSGNSGASWGGFNGGQFNFNAGVNPSALAAGDFNGDGRLDLIVTNAGSDDVTVFTNTTAGQGPVTFNRVTVAVGDEPVSVVTGVLRDVSAGNGAIDAAVVNRSSDSVTLLFNTSGTLAAAATLATGDAPTDITAALLDLGEGRAGSLDLAVTNGGDGTVSAFFRAPGGGYPLLPSRVLPVGTQPSQVEPGGLDNPKEINDLCVTNAGSGTVSVLLNSSTDTTPGFLPKADFSCGDEPTSLTLGDLDQDGDGDLSVVTRLGSSRVVRVFRNDKQEDPPNSGNYQAALSFFGDVYQNIEPRLVDSADVNNDARDDLIAVNDQSAAMRNAGEAGSSHLVGQLFGAGAQISRLSCRGDLVNNDGLVNTADLTFFLGRFGTAVPPGTNGDLNGDGQVNTADLTTFLGRFGQPCQ
ncbi:MAG: FG-GAP-like repeat-containing protein [Phycisphaerales bacterium]